MLCVNFVMRFKFFNVDVLCKYRRFICYILRIWQHLHRFKILIKNKSNFGSCSKLKNKKEKYVIREWICFKIRKQIIFSVIKCVQKIEEFKKETENSKAWVAKIAIKYFVREERKKRKAWAAKKFTNCHLLARYLLLSCIELDIGFNHILKEARKAAEIISVANKRKSGDFMLLELADVLETKRRILKQANPDMLKPELRAFLNYEHALCATPAK